MYLPQRLLEMQKLKASDVESLAEIVPGWGHQISRHFRWCQVIWLVPRDFNCANSSSIGKRVQAWLAHRVPVRLSNSSSIVNEQSSCACKVGNLSDGALLRTASSGDAKIESVWCGVRCQVIWLVPRDFNCSNSSSIGRGCRRGWPTAFLSDWATPVRSSMSSLPALARLEIYQMERCSGRLHWQVGYSVDRVSVPDVLMALLTSAGLTLDLDRFSTSSSQSPFYLQAAESAFVTYCESMWRTKGSPCPFRIEMTRTGERRKKEDMMVASQAEDPKLYVAHTRSQQHRLKI